MLLKRSTQKRIRPSKNNIEGMRWHKWFAWYPVRFVRNDIEYIVFMRTIYRRYNVIKAYYEYSVEYQMNVNLTFEDSEITYKRILAGE